MMWKPVLLHVDDLGLDDRLVTPVNVTPDSPNQGICGYYLFIAGIIFTGIIYYNNFSGHCDVFCGL